MAVDSRNEPEDEEGKLDRRQAVWKHLRDSRGARYENCRLENFEAKLPAQKPALEKLEKYVAEIPQRIADGQNIFLFGPCGTGKDHLAFAVCYAAVTEFFRVRWVNGSSLWLALRKAIADENTPQMRLSSGFESSLSGTEGQIVRKLQMADLLAISDPCPGRDSLTAHRLEILLEILDARYSALRPTIVTMNVKDRQEGEEKLGAPAVDRLLHGGLAVACTWPSYRQADL